MKGIDFLESMSEIDDQYILEIEEKKVTRIHYKQILSYAATFLMICTLSFAGVQYWGNTTNQDTMIVESMDGVMPIEETEIGVKTIEEENSESEQKNIFENIFESIVSFFENLRF